MFLYVTAVAVVLGIILLIMKVVSFINGEVRNLVYRKRFRKELKRE